MLHVRTTSRFNGVEVTIDDTVEILGDNLRRLVKLVVVEGLRLPVHVLGKGDRSEIAHRRFILVGIFQDLGTVTCENTIKHTTMFEWLIETERVRHVTKVSNGNYLLKVKCLAVWLSFGLEIQAFRLKTERLQKFNSTTWNEKTP